MGKPKPPLTEIGPPTVLIGGMYDGQKRPTVTVDGVYAREIRLPSIDGSCAVGPDDMVIGDVRFDQVYYLETYDVHLSNGVVCRYAYWCHETMLAIVLANPDMIPLEECYVQRMSNEVIRDIRGPFIADGRGDVIGLN